MDAPTPREVESDLADAHGARASLIARGNWFRKYLLVFAAGSVAVVLLIGLGGRTGATIATMLWLSLVAAMSWWGTRQRVVLRGHKRRSFLSFGGWGVLYGITLVVGVYAFPGQPAFWLPAAAITAIPLVLGACWPAGGDDGRRPGIVATAHNP